MVVGLALPLSTVPAHAAPPSPSGSVRATVPTGDAPREVTIAAVQTDPLLGAKAENLADMQARSRAAAAEGADLIVFPELALSGYKYKTVREARRDAEPVPGPSTAAMAATAAETGSYIVFGMLESDGQDLYDAVVLVGPEGYVGKYSKITMGHASESLLFTRGPSAPPVFDTALGKIGIASCYDGAFPENARLLGLQGAEILVLADTENGTTWRDYVRTRAVENGAFAVVSNRVGEERLSTFNGHSLIADPHYNLLANASTDQVETIFATVDLDEATGGYLDERRPELYGALTEPLEAGVLATRATPQSSVLGAAATVDLNVVTASVPTGTAVTAELLDAAGRVRASATGTVGVDQARAVLEVPADLAAGDHTLRYTVGEHTAEETFTVKESPRPEVLGVLPEGTDANAAGTAYVGFDTELEPSSSVPLELHGPDGVIGLTGTVNLAGTDNRVSASYRGLRAGAEYRLVVPAGAVEAVDGTLNIRREHTFTVRAADQTVTAAVAQPALTPLDVEANLASVLASIEQADAAGVELLTLPELALTGDTFADRAQALAVAEELDSDTVAALETRVDELDLHVSVGLLEKDGDDLFSTVALFGPDGLIGTHRGTHVDPAQADVLEAGDAVSPVFDTEVGPIGLVTGYENYFPEVVRSLTLRGALVMAGSYSETGTVWRELARSRGSENKVYMLAANDVASGGTSLITRTSRGIDAQLGGDAGLAAFAINLTTIANRYYSYVDRNTSDVRTTHYLLDRRPHLYGPISEVATSTSIRFNRAQTRYGAGGLRARVDVDGALAPRGEVTLRSGTTVLGTAPVADGTASIALPRTALAPGRRAITATFTGAGFVSSTVTGTLTVRRAAATVRAKVKPARAGGPKARARVVLEATGGVPVTGRVEVAVQGRTRSARMTRLAPGTATVVLPSLRPGRHRVVVRYLGSSTVAPGRTVTRVLIRH